MRASGLGAAATRLPWLSPSATSLVALARPPSAAGWETIRFDPGCVLLLVRRGAADQPLVNLSLIPNALRDPLVLDEAVRLLDAGAPAFVDWGRDAVAPVHRIGLTCARLASAIARRSGQGDPDRAWAAGLLAPLGWYTVAAVDPQAVQRCLNDPDWPADPEAAQRRHWGLEHAAIARRLNRLWRLPRWLAAVTGHLGLPVESAQHFGADPDLFLTVQLAAGLAQRRDQGLRLPVGATPEQCAAGLGLPAGELESLQQVAACETDRLPEGFVWHPPAGVPLLRDYLLLAAENRRLAEGPALEDLENDLDHLHRALREQHRGEGQRLRASKLNALAEFAAGAGHEINNPLAVISGQAQYLLARETDAGRQKSLRTVIAQAGRIHLVLKELMNFARPPRPQKQSGDVPTLMREVVLSLGDLAAQRRVQLQCAAPEQPVRYFADPRQAHTALGCLLRNAIEAAPADGWASVRLETPTPERLDLVVEDNGPGPTRLQCEHLFDPFYSGRPAGRGRGLGLPTAWRLARENGGEVRFEELPQGPTRFILSLPRDPGTNGNGFHQEPLPWAKDAEVGNGSIAPAAGQP